MADARPQPKGRLRRWLDKRREAQRRGAEIGERAKSVRKADADHRARRGGGDSGGPYIGGI